ncbi:MAG: serine protease, partial [Actinomycetota bacterium]|nr:serine protease [Actinomycetota bacterium]
MRSGYPPPGGGRRGGPGRVNPFSQENLDETFRLLTPPNVAQLAIWLLMFSLGAGLSGLIFFAIYQGQLNSAEERIMKSQEELSKSIDDRLRRLQSGDAGGSGEFKSSGLPIGDGLPDPEQVIRNIEPSLAGVEGVDPGGAPVSGSGFVFNNAGEESWVLTNYRLVAGALGEFQTVGIRIGDVELPSAVYSTDPVRDLALVIYKGGGVRPLRFSSEAPKVGDPVWAAVAPRRAAPARAVRGTVTEVGATSISTDLDLPPNFSGGPLIDQQGRVVGVLTSNTSVVPDKPGGRQATPIDLACVEVVRCPR